ERDPYPSLKTSASRMNVTRRQVSNYTQSLRNKGCLLVHERSSPGLGQVTSEYDFQPLIEAVTRLAQAGTPSATPMKNSSGGGMKNISRAPMNSTSTEEDEDQEDRTRRIHTSNVRNVKPTRKSSEGIVLDQQDGRLAEPREEREHIALVDPP